MEDLNDDDSLSIRYRRFRQEVIFQTKKKITHMIVIVNKIMFRYRYDVFDIDKMDDLNGHNLILIRY